MQNRTYTLCGILIEKKPIVNPQVKVKAINYLFKIKKLS